MLILIRRIRRDRKGNEELFEQTVDGSTVTIGHRNDQDVQLLDPEIAPQHAEVRAGRGGAFEVRAIGAAVLRRDGKQVQRARLTPGQGIEIGRQTLTAAIPPHGFDAVVEVAERAPDEEYGPATHFIVDLNKTGVRSRPWSWAALFLIPLLFLLIPISAHFSPAVGSFLRMSTPLPTDAVWSSGALSQAHHSPEVGDDCTVCHAKLFEPTPDRACLQCHQHVNEHYDQARLGGGELLGAKRCASCHVEHNEPGNLLRHDNKLCVDCHEDLTKIASEAKPGELSAPVHGFGGDAHPPFRLSLLRFDDSNWAWSGLRTRADVTPAPREQSNLKFSHLQHMDASRVKVAGTNEAPGCQTCHSLGTDREHFAPITMEKHCRSCHSLAFDEEEPSRQLPHADVPAAVMALEEHFITRFVDPSTRGESATGTRRRPGQGSAMVDPCNANPLTCARERAELEARNQFTRSGCVTCHVVTEDLSKPLRERWRVKPVRLVSDWYPNAHFDHPKHLTPGVGGAELDKTCRECHQSDVSRSSADILIPGLSNCLKCHGDQDALGIVRLGCDSCHGFHQASGSPFHTLNSVIPVPGRPDPARK